MYFFRIASKSSLKRKVLGVKEVRLLVWVGNPIALRFYSKLGFKAYARVRHPGFEEAVAMIKELS